MTSNQICTQKSGWFFIPTLYFAEGLPYIIINSVIVIFYKRLHIPNEIIAFWTGWITLPWALKLLWGPVIDIYLTKKKWILITQSLLALIFGIVCQTLKFEDFFTYSIVAFGLIAFISATQDISIDGYYLISLNKKDQAFFIGIRTTFYRIAMITGSGLLVFTGGKLEKIAESVGSTNDFYTNIILKLVTAFNYKVTSIKEAWNVIFYFVAILFTFFTFYHLFILPEVEDKSSHKKNENNNQSPKLENSIISFKSAFYSFFEHSFSGKAILFILLYRFAENLLMKIASPFMLDSTSNGGLGLSTEEVGIAYGTVGLICVMLGGIAGGYFVSKYSFRKTIWLLAIALNIPDILYVIMAYYNTIIPKYLVYLLVAIEQLGFGLGTTAFVVYIVYISDGKYKSSHYAIATGIMALGASISSSVSGYIQKFLGYTNFFIFVCFCTLFSFISVLFILNDPRIPDNQAKQN